MLLVPWLFALASAGGQLSFAGAVTTPTADVLSMLSARAEGGVLRIVAQPATGASPLHTLSIRPPQAGAGFTEVVVTYL